MKPLILVVMVVFLGACSSSAPQLSAPLLTPRSAKAAVGSATQGQRLMADRAFGRSGFACLDCHANRNAPSRGGPPFPPEGSSFWSGATPQIEVAVNLCIERFQQRESVQGQTLGALSAAVLKGEWPRPAPPGTPTSHPDEPRVSERGRRQYLARCGGCHEGGPAGAVLGKLWSRAALRAAIRGDGRRPRSQFMPIFSARVLRPADLEAVIEFVLLSNQ